MPNGRCVFRTQHGLGDASQLDQLAAVQSDATFGTANAMDVSRPSDRDGSALRPPMMSPRSSRSRPGHADPLSFQSQLQQPSTTSAEPWRPPVFSALNGAVSGVSSRSPVHIAGPIKHSLFGGSEAISPLHTDREIPIARVDPWPLSLSPVASPRRLLPTKLTQSSSRDDHADMSSTQQPPPPLALSTDGSRRPETYELPNITAAPSPRKQRQTQARQKARLIEESKLQPALLQELQSFLVNELQKLEGPSDGAATPDDRKEPASLQRLQVFRALFQRLIEAFSVYAPLLTLVREEYERVISVLRARSEQLPRLRSQLQTLETQCLQEISLHSLEERARVLALKKQLKNTQGRLTACAAQNSSLRGQIGLLQRDVTRLEARSDGLQLSNHTLVSSIQRHDETLQQVHQRSVDEGQALQQITQKYYHACDEITELKKTITHLEEKVDGVQVAADKSTIALLTKELQDLQSSTHGASSTMMPSGARTAEAMAHSVLNSAFVRAFQAVGVPITLPALLESVTDGLSTASGPRSDADFKPGIEKTAQAIQLKLLQLKQQQSAMTATQTVIGNSDMGAAANEAAIFLTEPPEQESSSLSRVESGSAPVNALGCLFIPIQDYLPCRGIGSAVPEHLQFDGVVRNFHFSLETVEQLMGKIWDLQDEIAKARAKSGSVISAASSSSAELQSVSSSKEVDPRLRSRSLHLPPLRAVLVNFLHRSCASKTEMAETSYNLVAGLNRFSSVSSDCRLFKLVLDRDAPDDARHDRDREINALHDALVVSDRERQSGFQSPPSSTTTSAAADTEEFAVPPGHASVSEVIRSLRLLFPWKTDASLAQLHRALLQEVRGRRCLDYAALLRHHAHASVHTKAKGISHRTCPPGGRFVECLKSQYIDDIVDYRRYLQQQITQELTKVAQIDAVELEQHMPATTGADDPPREAGISTAVPELPARGTHMISLLALRDCLQRCDPAKTAYDIATVLSAVSGLSATQILIQDDTKVDGRHVIACLPTLLVRPSGRFTRSAASEAT